MVRRTYLLQLEQDGLNARYYQKDHDGSGRNTVRYSNRRKKHLVRSVKYWLGVEYGWCVVTVFLGTAGKDFIYCLF